MVTKHALIVDDSKTAQFRLRKLLQGYDLTIIAVDSAEAALSHLSSRMPDVVFLDHMMPGLDGFRALQIIKSHPVTAAIPVIMYTSKSGDQYASEARALGALDILNKNNVDAEQLRMVLSCIDIYPTEPETVSTAPVPQKETNASLKSDGLLAVERRMRELERVIDDNQQLVTTRLTKELLGVRHGLRRLLGEVEELKKQQPIPATTSTPATKRRPRRYATALATVLLVAAVGASLYWAPEIYQKMDQAVAYIQKGIHQYQSTEAQTPQAQTHALATTTSADFHLYNPMLADGHALAVIPDRSMELLPELAWAFNQSSIQDFHAEGIDPALTKRLDELASRLAQRSFQGVIELQVSGGDFCVVTNLSGKPRLPHTGAQMRDCMLISELYGTEATHSKIQQLRAALANAAALEERRITITVLPNNETFDAYPAMDARTFATDWNEAARQNNRVLISLKPQAPAQTALRQ